MHHYLIIFSLDKPIQAKDYSNDKQQRQRRCKKVEMYSSFHGDLTPHANTVKPYVYREGQQQYIMRQGGNGEALFIEH